MLSPWLEPTFKKITRAYWQKKMGHAFLLTGEPGLGITELVETLAQFLLCRSPSVVGPCQHCRSCELYLKNAHPDYCILGGDEEGVSIDEIRELHSFLQQTPHQGGYKIVTLYQADKLSIYTANALLKNLEEPSDQTLFLLVGRLPQNVLPTLRSRCIPVQVPASSTEILPVGLNNDLKEALFWGDSRQFNQESTSQKLNDQTKETLYLFYNWVAEYCRYGLTRKAVYLSVPKEKDRVDKLLDGLPVEKAFTFLDKIIESIESLNVTGINKGLLWASLVYQWRQLQKENLIK
jgi:DNA polymerase III delta' subunit